jgi:hypothetical protein
MVRFSTNSGHRTAVTACPLRANSGLAAINEFPSRRHETIPLDPVRRTGHQQFGRFEKFRGGGWVCHSGSIRQHKDDLCIIVHVPVIVVLRFGYHDGAHQIKVCHRSIEHGFGVIECPLRRVAMFVPVQYAHGVVPEANDYWCDFSRVVGKDWLCGVG